jgi:hypothetical protein
MFDSNYSAARVIHKPGPDGDPVAGKSGVCIFGFIQACEQHACFAGLAEALLPFPGKMKCGRSCGGPNAIDTS